MPQWTVFAVGSIAIAATVLVLARMTQTFVRQDQFSQPIHHSPDIPTKRSGDRTKIPSSGELSSTWILVNVSLSQGVFTSILLGLVWYSQIPRHTLGLPVFPGFPVDVFMGLVLGIILYIGAESGRRIGERMGFDRDESLRSLLAPRSGRGWCILLLGVLPLVAVFEEFLFRGILIGGISAGFGISPWLLAVGSSIAFGFGHGAQGRGGIVITGVLGLSLAAMFIVFNSLALVIVAHYTVNATEFIVQEGLNP